MTPRVAGIGHEKTSELSKQAVSQTRNWVLEDCFKAYLDGMKVDLGERSPHREPWVGTCQWSRHVPTWDGHCRLVGHGSRHMTCAAKLSAASPIYGRQGPCIGHPETHTVRSRLQSTVNKHFQDLESLLVSTKTAIYRIIRKSKTHLSNRLWTQFLALHCANSDQVPTT